MMVPKSIPDSFYETLGVSDAVVANIKRYLQDESKMPDAMRLLDEHSRQRLLLAFEIVDICGDNFVASELLLRNERILSLSDVALEHYCAMGGVEGMAEIRYQLLYRVPTAVMSSIVDRDDILKLAPDIRSSLSRLLKLAVQEQFDIRTSSLGKFIAQPACQEALSGLLADDACTVSGKLETLYRLYPLVEDAEDIGHLINAGFTSAHHIASTTLDDFFNKLKEEMLEKKIKNIHLEATRIDERNDAVWAQIIRSRHQVPVLAITGINQPDSSLGSDPSGTNLATLFNDLDSVTTDNSTSVLGPACYLVDLLQMLRRATLKLPATRTVKKAENALDILFHRRPDIASITLSKAEVETPMTYVDLAIEVMEHHLNGILEPGWDSKDEKKKEETKEKIYATLSRQLAPMTIFPYNDAIASSREFLQARGYSRYELLRRFRSDLHLAQRAFPSIQPIANGQTHVVAAQKTHERRLAAECLRLQPVDFQAITQEAFYTREFVRLLQGQAELAAETYGQVVGLSTTGEYWGYHSEEGKVANWKMLDPASETNLRLVKSQLLMRSGLTLSQLNIVLKTRYIGKRLVLTLANGEGFSNLLQDMRLQESLLITHSEEAGRLSERTCLDLQAFIRLRYRLGWSFETVDAAIAVLARRSKIYENDNYRHYVLDGGFVERLAAAQQLSTQTAIPLVELLPFWGPMDAQFPSSLYAKLFLRVDLLEQCPSLNLVNGDTQNGATFGQNMRAMPQALGMTQTDQLVFMDLLNFKDETPWTLDRIAQLYSHHRICKLLDLPTARYREWWDFSQKLANPFLDPQSSLAVLSPWFHLPDGISSAEVALDLLAPLDEKREPSAADLNTVSKIIQGMAEVESQYADAVDLNATSRITKYTSDIGSQDAEAPDHITETAQIFSSDALFTMCSRVLGPTAAKAVVEFIEGCSGSDSSSAFRIFRQHFSRDESIVNAMHKKPISQTEPYGREIELLSRRRLAMRLMIEELKHRAMDDVVYSSLAARFPDVDSQLLQSFLAEKAPESVGNTEWSCLQHLKDIWGNLKAWFKDAGSNDTYFFPPTTAGYTFITEKEGGQLMLDHQVVELSTNAKEHVTQRPMRQGQASLMSFMGGLSLKDIRYSTSKAEGPFCVHLVCSVELAKRASLILSYLERSLNVAKALDLDTTEVSFYRDDGIVLSNLDPRQTAHLQSFVRARKEFNTSGESLIRYCRYLHRVSNLSLESSQKGAMEQLVVETHRVTKLTTTDISTFFDKEWPCTSASQRAEMLLGLSPLLRLAECCEMAKTLAVPMTTLYRWAELSHLPNKPEGFDSIHELQTALSSGIAVNALTRAKESLRFKQQRILQECLLRQPTIKSKKITTIDQLSAELLMDLQMGPVLQTSRIGQAIASVQLFVHRCLLGLEKVYGIPTTSIDQTRWKWMCKYTLWQANRKVFLYPENWIDPSLRDDKTQAFEELESKMLQTNLNKESIAQLLREYVYAAHEVADLEVQAYLWEATGGSRGNYHFFARTRTVPFTFYYRRVAMTGASGRPNWLPWTKMEVDIPTHEVDVNNKALSRPGSYLLPAMFKGRLFLFIPQITRQVTPAKPESRSLYDVARDGAGAKAPTEHWEVKMAWTEMRNNKWSPKYMSATGINVTPSEIGVLPSISSFRFRVETRDSNQTLAIYMDRWGREIYQMYEKLRLQDKERGLRETIKNFKAQLNRRKGFVDYGEWVEGSPLEAQLGGRSAIWRDEASQQAHQTEQGDDELRALIAALENDLKDVQSRLKAIEEESRSGYKNRAPPDEAHPAGFENLGRFEMQGHQLLSKTKRDSMDVIGAPIGAGMEFGRMSRNISPHDTETLLNQVRAYTIGINPRTQNSLLAVPNPEDVKGTDYTLTWLLSFDSSQFPGASGLVVERSSASQVQSFVGFPNIKDGRIDNTRKITLETMSLTHGTALRMVEKIAYTEGYDCIFDVLEQLPKEMVGLAFGNGSNMYGELASPSSLYNWEMGFHAVSLLMERLLATQQFDLALELSRLVFDPSRDDMDAPSGVSEESSGMSPKPLSRLDRCWRFVPFKSSELRLGGSVRDIIQHLAPNEESDQIAHWEANPFSPHAVARQRPAVYMKRFVMKCIEILIASGDQYFRQNSLEAVPLAIERYTEALELFGPAPIAIDAPTKPVAKTYADIRDLVNGFATASVDMELEFPYFLNPSSRQANPQLNELHCDKLGFVRSTYFGVPANSQIKALRDLIDDRLYKIRNGLDINGNLRRLPLFDPPIDPGQLLAALSPSLTLSSFVGGSSHGPMPNYRAKYLLQKALELCSELRAMSDAYVSIKERRDAEALASLRVRQESGVLSLLTEVKQHQIQEATLSIESLEESRKGHVMRLQYFLALTGESADDAPMPETDWVDLEQDIAQPTKDELRMSPEEWLEMKRIEDAMHSNEVAVGMEMTAAILMALPNLTIQGQPLGVGVSTQLDASIAARAMMVGVGAIRATAQASVEKANQASRKAQLIRQLQERRMQANAAGRDIKTVDKEIASQRKRVEMTQAEFHVHQQRIADTAETEAYLRTKYTSEKLYAWLDVETRKLAYQAYLAALDMAKTAEQALLFEYGPRSQPQSFLSNTHWDEAHDGLLAAQNLTAALHRMDNFHIQNTTHDYELIKAVSLRQVSPLALIDLRTKGVADFEIPEVLFDQDFPGHYCRRIKAVSVSIPSIVGPYAGVNCTLRLLQHRYRLKASTSVQTYYAQDPSNDERFHTDRIPISAIALSSCNQDSGTFELNFNGERYIPFEGAGVISNWRLQFPAPYPQFDYRSISDVLITIHYTALEGGAIWKKQAADAVQQFRKEVDQELKGGAFLLIDLRADFPNEWRLFSTQMGTASRKPASSENTPVKMDLSRIKQLLPFWSSKKTVMVQRVWAALEPKVDKWDSGVTVLDEPLGDQGTGNELKLLATRERINKELKDFSISATEPKDIPQNFWLVIQYTQS